jgi:hypothetical protein
MTLEFGSELNVMATGGFDPAMGDVFDIIDATAINGTFSTILLPTLGDGKSWDSENLYATGEIQVIPEPATLSLLALGGLLALHRRRR